MKGPNQFGGRDPWSEDVMSATKNLPSQETSARPEWEGEPMRHVSLGDIESAKEHQAKYIKERDESK